MAMAELRLVSIQPTATQVMAIKALAEPQTLPKIAGLFAQFGVVPVTFCCQRDGSYLCIDVQFDATGTSHVDLLLAKIRSMVVVQRAGLTDR